MNTNTITGNKRQLLLLLNFLQEFLDIFIKITASAYAIENYSYQGICLVLSIMFILPELAIFVPKIKSPTPSALSFFEHFGLLFQFILLLLLSKADSQMFFVGVFSCLMFVKTQHNTLIGKSQSFFISCFQIDLRSKVMANYDRSRISIYALIPAIVYFIAPGDSFPIAAGISLIGYLVFLLIKTDLNTYCKNCSPNPAAQAEALPKNETEKQNKNLKWYNKDAILLSTNPNILQLTIGTAFGSFLAIYWFFYTQVSLVSLNQKSVGLYLCWYFLAKSGANWLSGIVGPSSFGSFNNFRGEFGLMKAILVSGISTFILLFLDYYLFSDLLLPSGRIAIHCLISFFFGILSYGTRLNGILVFQINNNTIRSDQLLDAQTRLSAPVTIILTLISGFVFSFGVTNWVFLGTVLALYLFVFNTNVGPSIRQLVQLSKANRN